MDIAPFPDGTEVFKANRYIADQSPLLMEEPSGFFTQYSESLPKTSLREQPQLGSADGPQEFFEVTLASEDLSRRAAPSSGAS